MRSMGRKTGMGQIVSFEVLVCAVGQTSDYKLTPPPPLACTCTYTQTVLHTDTSLLARIHTHTQMHTHIHTYIRLACAGWVSVPVSRFKQRNERNARAEAGASRHGVERAQRSDYPTTQSRPRGARSRQIRCRHPTPDATDSVGWLAGKTDTHTHTHRVHSRHAFHTVFPMTAEYSAFPQSLPVLTHLTNLLS